tara:strand:+ start:1417 stop:1674 length:258 start_codon:yes stop_codon:yes gene_type:complete
MTNREIVDKVESWNWNLSIFEIYDEVKDMGKHGYMGGQRGEGSDLSRLLNHAYEYFNYDSMIKELMSFLGVEIELHEDKELTSTS